MGLEISWSDPRLRDWWQMLFDYVELPTFFVLRRLSRSAWRASYKNQSQWYKWLSKFGKHDGWELQDHNSRGSCDGKGCMIACHYRVSRPKPLVLKMTPLYTQCFQQGLSKRCKHSQRALEAALAHKQGCERAIIEDRATIARLLPRVEEMTKDLIKIKPAKRQRITLNISKP
jgi:hypothetical protein